MIHGVVDYSQELLTNKWIKLTRQARQKFKKILLPKVLKVIFDIWNNKYILLAAAADKLTGMEDDEDPFPAAEHEEFEKLIKD